MLDIIDVKIDQPKERTNRKLERSEPPKKRHFVTDLKDLVKAMAPKMPKTKAPFKTTKMTVIKRDASSSPAPDSTT